MLNLVFRGWSDETKSFHYLTIAPGVFPQHQPLLVGVAIVAWMQYTGLSDKNGVEIYERDIILREGCEWWDEVGVNTKIEVQDIASLPTKAGDWSIDIENYQIIGNILENPELITD